MLKNWFTLFIYHFKNHKLFSILNMLGLSIGIAGLVFALLYYNDEYNYNAWNPYKDRVFQVQMEVSKDMVWANVPEPLGQLIGDAPEVEVYNYSNNYYYETMVYFQNKKELVSKVYDAQANFFDIFPFEFLAGTPRQALKNDNTIALEETIANKIFGSPQAALHQSVRMGKAIRVVEGVYRIPGKSSVAPNLICSADVNSQLKENKGQWGNFNFSLMLKLKNPADSSKVVNKINQIFYINRTLHWAKEEGMTPEEYIKKNGRNKSKLLQLENARLHSSLDSFPEGKGNYQFLMIMVGLSVLILVLSIVNYVNLATANAIKRAKEVGVRKILGASKTNIIAQFLFETVITSLFSILLAMVIVELTLPYYNQFLGKHLIIYGSQFYGQLVIVFVCTVLVAGFFPAVYVANFETLKVLKGNFTRSKSGIWLRNAMLIIQFAIASFFIIGFTIVYQQIQYMNTMDLGFKGNQVVTIQYRNPYDWREEGVKERLYQRFMTIKNELMKMDGVEGVSTGAFRFGDGANSSSSFEYKNHTVQGQNMGIDYDMLDMMNIQVVQGRKLSPKFASDSINTMLINETAARQMHEKNPVGKEIDWNTTKLKVVGVVKDFNLYGPQAEIPPMAFFHFKTIDWMIFNVNRIYVKVKADKMEETLKKLEKYWGENVDTEYPFKYDFVDKEYARTYETYVQQKNLFSMLNVIVIAIALFGLFSLASFSIQRRMKEIAIRKTLGAETNVLLTTLSKQYVVYCSIGFVIAVFPVYFFLNQWLQNFVFRIQISPVPFIIGFLFLLALTLIIVISRAYQATRVDVLKYLKYE